MLPYTFINSCCCCCFYLVFFNRTNKRYEKERSNKKKEKKNTLSLNVLSKNTTRTEAKKWNFQRNFTNSCRVFWHRKYVQHSVRNLFSLTIFRRQQNVFNFMNFRNIKTCFVATQKFLYTHFRYDISNRRFFLLFFLFVRSFNIRSKRNTCVWCA